MYVSPFFFFNDTATTEIYTLSLHDALPIFLVVASREDDDRHGRTTPAKLLQKLEPVPGPQIEVDDRDGRNLDRKSTRLNSSHGYISYAVFCLKKKKHKMQSYLDRITLKSDD